MIAQPYRCNRVDQIVNIDMNAQLMTIRDLEAKLSEHHRSDRIPDWAESLMRRVELLESAALAAPKVPLVPSDGSALPPPEDPETLDAICDQMKATFDAQMASNRLTQENRIEQVTFELERLRQLMAIRPTTAEFQLVVVSLNDVHRRMYDSLDDIAAGIGGTVQERVAIEMDLFMQQLNKNERSNTKRIQIALDKTERIGKSILELSEVSATAIDEVNSEAEEMRTDITALKRECLKAIERSGEKASRSDLELGELIKANERATQVLIDDLHRRCADERFLIISNSVTDARDAIEVLKEKLEFDYEKMQMYTKESRGTVNHALASIIQRIGGSEETGSGASGPSVRPGSGGSGRPGTGGLGRPVTGGSVARCAFNQKTKEPVKIIPLLEKHEETLRGNAVRMRSMEEQLEAMSAQLLKSQLLEEGLNSRINALLSTSKQKEDQDVKTINTSLSQSHVKLTELFNSMEQHKEAIARLERSAKNAQFNITNLTTTTEEHRTRLTAVQSDIAAFEARVTYMVENMTQVCFAFIVEKHDEVVRQCIFLNPQPPYST